MDTRRELTNKLNVGVDRLVFTEPTVSFNIIDYVIIIIVKCCPRKIDYVAFV